MKKSTIMWAGIAALVGCSGMAAGQADVIVGELRGVSQSGGEGPRLWGSIGNVSAYSIGTTSCNTGNVNLNWFANGLNHPVIATNMYRLKDGHLEQLGMAWVKHGFCALQQNACGLGCQPAGGGCASQLGPGCSDPYSSFLNGSQGGLGPRSEVNAATGGYQWPYSTDGQGGDTLYKRIQVNMDDLDPAQNAGAIYFGEGQYVAADDTNAGNDNNNASYREFRVGNLSGSGYATHWVGTTIWEKCAVEAWADYDAGVTVEYVDVPNDGRFVVGYKVTDNGDGTYHYAYSIFNLNSYRSASGVAFPVGSGATTSNHFFSAPDYHSGEPYDNSDWTASEGGGTLSWDNGANFITDPNANALRWSTTYTVAFDSDAAPVAGDMTLNLWTIGAPSDVAVPVMVPGEVDTCVADINNDGEVDIFDVLNFISLLQNGDAEADWNGDTIIDTFDVFAFLADFEDC